MLIAIEFRVRGPIIIFNCLCLITGFAMLGFAEQVTVRYVGVFLATGAYVSNWAALNSYQANNITGLVISSYDSEAELSTDVVMIVNGSAL